MNGLDSNSLTASIQTQAAEAQGTVQTVPLQLLESLIDNELGKDVAVTPAHGNDIDFDLEELGAEDTFHQNTVLLFAAHDAGRSMLDSLNFEFDTEFKSGACDPCPDR